VKKIFIHKTEITKQWGNAHNEKLHNLYYYAITIRVKNSCRKRWALYIACIREMRNVFKIQSENLKEIDHLKDLGTDGKY
jgi:hypothetical protein